MGGEREGWEKGRGGRVEEEEEEEEEGLCCDVGVLRASESGRPLLPLRGRHHGEKARGTRLLNQDKLIE